MRLVALLVAIIFTLAVAEQQQEDGIKQEPQSSYDENQASYGSHFYHPAERPFVPNNARWFIRTTTTSTSTSKINCFFSLILSNSIHVVNLSR